MRDRRFAMSWLFHRLSGGVTFPFDCGLCRVLLRTKDFEQTIHFVLTRTNTLTGVRYRDDPALRELRVAAKLNENFFGLSAVDAMEKAYAASGKRAFLEQSLAGRRFYPHPEYSVALDCAALGDKDRAFDALESAVRDHDLDVLSLLSAPEFDGLRGDPRYRSLIRRIGLPASRYG